MSQAVLTHSSREGWRRWQLELSTGVYALSHMAGGTVHLVPLLEQASLIANPGRSTSLMKGWAPLEPGFRKEFEAHLLRRGLDPLEAELVMAEVKELVSELVRSIG